MTERVVFDTNVMISGLLWKGKPYHCLLLARSRIIQSVYCNPMLGELSEKLRGKFKYSENRIHAVAADIRRYAERVEIAGSLQVVRADPDDDKFVECAVAGQASFIISSDHHLLDLGEYQNIKIVSPEEFLSLFT
ncbi:MAG: putative toxin-antitoxin system toxin component, PIN family [Anaerolineales bacterium]|nr:putative toxin-antitoxin system toxin component, PIN family [Anaerolineales bacterium]